MPDAATPIGDYPRARIDAIQRTKLAALLDRTIGRNAFYDRKLAGISFDPHKDPIQLLPLTTRAELQQDQLEHPPFGSNLTQSPDRYVRMHQSSGSAGTPLRWLDTAESWDWFLRCWGVVLDAAGVSAADRVFVPFSFGPFIGFWGAFEAATRLGCLTLSGGGMSTPARLRLLIDLEATVVCCTPTYAMHMSDVAAGEKLPLRDSRVRALIVAGEPGGSVPAVRRRIETAWGARVFDHAGMTEVGAWGYETPAAAGGLLVLETEFIAECLDPQSLLPVAPGGTGELVLTNLGRLDCPAIRYRTGDLVAWSPSATGVGFVRASGGLLGRLDDMLFIRGVKVLPSAIESILREFDEVAEFRIDVEMAAALPELRLTIEPARGEGNERLAERIALAMRDRLQVRPRVELTAPGTLPRFELKARRLSRYRR